MIAGISTGLPSFIQNIPFRVGMSIGLQAPTPTPAPVQAPAPAPTPTNQNESVRPLSENAQNAMDRFGI